MSLLPANSTPLERAIEQVITPRIPINLETLWHPDTCPAGFLPWLAWALHVDTWDLAYTEAMKRASIRQSIAIHKKKGTLGAVRNALSVIGVDAEIVEWQQQTPPGPVHSFGLRAWVNDNLTPGGTLLNGTVYKRLAALVTDVKPARSQCVFSIGARFDQKIRLTGALRPLQVARFLMETQP